jgi:hypothetical protein
MCGYSAFEARKPLVKIQGIQVFAREVNAALLNEPAHAFAIFARN